MRPQIIAGLAAVALIAGCDGGGVPVAMPPVAPAAPSPSATIATGAYLGVVRKVTAFGASVNVTALKYKRAGSVEAVQVRVCSLTADVAVTTNPWSLSYEGGEQLQHVTVTGGGLPSPAYGERDLAKGECAKGWISFEAVAGQRPDGVQYAPEGAPLIWQFKEGS